MSNRKLLAAAATVVAGTLAFSACTPQPSTGQGGQVNTESTVSVMWNQPFYSYNNVTTFGNATANANIVYLTSDAVTYYDNNLEVQANEGFASYEKVADEPLSVKVTFADTAQWSDGTPVTAADLVLSYAAQSGLYNTITDSAEVDGLYNEDGTMKTTEEGKVFFDASTPSLALITEFPEITDDGKSMTYKYSKIFGDWDKAILTPGLPAHIVAKRALGTTDAAAGQQAIIDAFKNKDNAALSKIANVWNLDWNYTELPADPDLLVVNGPYKMTEYKKNEYLTVAKNENYKGSHVPAVDKITVRYNEDPMAAVQALQNGEVQLISPQSTADVLTALTELKDVTVISDVEGTYEHIDLTFNNGGPFDPATYGGDAEKAKLVRQAFLQTVPRAKIIDRIIKPLNPEAEIRNSFNTLPGSPNYADVVAANGMSTVYGGGDNVDKAKELLAQAGVTAPTVRVLYAQTNTRRIQQFQLIKESAEAAGFVVVDNGAPNWGEKLGDKSYDASLFGWQSTSTAITEADANYRSAADGRPAGVNNFGGYVSPRVNELYNELQSELDPARQKAINEEIEKILVDDAFGLTIFQFPAVTAHAATLEGIDPISISPTIFWNFWEWKVS